MIVDAIRLREGEKLDQYADAWVALSSKNREIICAFPSAKEALDCAKSKGEKDPILTRIPKRFDSYVL